MKIIEVRNVHEALPKALHLLNQIGVKRDSRNGPVMLSPIPVTTVYLRPVERVLFWPARDANPFLHLYESLWMLAGRNDLEPLTRYTKQFTEYSDDGKTLHGAYGHRWRKHFSGVNQIKYIGEALARNKDDRRCVLQMWDPKEDLGRPGKDVPCNLTVTFQINTAGCLDMVVFNRSNDIIWGAYGANAVHFSMLQEYVALKAGVEVGSYWQISTNWHAYETTLATLGDIKDWPQNPMSPYHGVYCKPVLMTDAANIDEMIRIALDYADTGAVSELGKFIGNAWFQVVINTLYAHRVYTSLKDKPTRFDATLDGLKLYTNIDWTQAATEWVTRRKRKFEEREAASIKEKA